MGPALEIKSGSGSTMEAPVNVQSGIVVKEEENNHKCVSNYEDYAFEMDASFGEQAGEGHRKGGGEINVADIADSGLNNFAEEKEITESSSSFDDVFGVENGADLSDDEVVSNLHQSTTSALTFDGYGEVFRMRKKRLTSHWKTYITPVLWRCKWVSLQVMKLNLLSQRYNNELAEYNRNKQIDIENPMADFCSKSVPFPSGSQRDKIMRRKKRRRIEDTDVTAYMSHHNLFSFYETQKVTAKCASLDDEQGNLGRVNHSEFRENDELLLLESTDTNQYLEQVLRKIETLRGQVVNHKSRLDKVMSDNAGKFSYVDNTSWPVPCNALTSSARDPASPPKDGDRMAVGSSYIASQLISQYNMVDGALPESAVSSHREVMHLPDVIESTNQSHLRGICDIEDDILIYNDRMKEGMNNFDEVRIQPMANPEAAKEQQESTNPTVPEESEMLTDDQPAPKIRSISRLTAQKSNKRKGRRKSGRGRGRRS